MLSDIQIENLSMAEYQEKAEMFVNRILQIVYKIKEMQV